MSAVARKLVPFSGKVRPAASSTGGKGAKNVRKNTYGERLRELRERAGVSGSFLAEKLGYKAPSGYYRYEKIATAKDAGDRPIPYETVIKAIGTFLVGRGTPPVTWDDLLAISTISGLPDDLVAAQKTNPRSATPSPGGVLGAFVASTEAQQASGLPVRWRVEPDIYMLKSKLLSPMQATTFAPILPSAEYPRSAQFAVSVLGGAEVYTLHVVATDQFSPAAAKGRPCVVYLPRPESDELGSLAVGTVQVTAGGKVVGRAGSDTGEVVGIAIRKLLEI